MLPLKNLYWNLLKEWVQWTSSQKGEKSQNCYTFLSKIDYNISFQRGCEYDFEREYVLWQKHWESLYYMLGFIRVLWNAVCKCNTLDLKLYHILFPSVALIFCIFNKKTWVFGVDYRWIPRVINTCKSHSGEKRHIEKKANDHIQMTWASNGWPRWWRNIFEWNMECWGLDWTGTNCHLISNE